MKKLFALLLIAFCASLHSCKKNEQQAPKIDDWEEVCDSIPPSLSLFGYERKLIGVSYESPCVYPNTPNKLLVFRIDFGDPSLKKELVEYDLTTKSEKILTKDLLINYPQVNRKGEVIFFMPDFNIYIYRNDSLERLTSVGENRYPNWSYTGNKYYYQHLVGQNLYYIEDKLDDTYIDTFPQSESYGIIGRYADINDENVMCCESGSNATYGLALVNLITRQKTTLYEKGFFDDGRAQIHCVRWHPNKQYVYYSDGYGLFRINVATKQKETVVQGCDTHWYHSFSFTPDGKYIYINRINYKKMSETLIHSKSRIYKMTDEGKNIEKVF